MSVTFKALENWIGRYHLQDNNSPSPIMGYADGQIGSGFNVYYYDYTNLPLYDIIDFKDLSVKFKGRFETQDEVILFCEQNLNETWKDPT